MHLKTCLEKDSQLEEVQAGIIESLPCKNAANASLHLIISALSSLIALNFADFSISE